MTRDTVRSPARFVPPFCDRRMRRNWRSEAVQARSARTSGGRLAAWLVVCSLGACAPEAPVVVEDEPAELKQVVEDAVQVEYHQFFLLGFKSQRATQLETPAKLLVAGNGGAVFLSGGTDHVANVKVELWSARPGIDTSRSWELTDEGVLTVEVSTLVFVGAKTSDVHIALGARGSYGVRAHCTGRAAANEAEIGDDLKYPTGLETWLIQLWRRNDRG